MDRKTEIENRLNEINSQLETKKNIEEGMAIPFSKLKSIFYKDIAGKDFKMKEEVVKAIAAVYQKYGIDII